MNIFLSKRSGKEDGNPVEWRGMFHSLSFLFALPNFVVVVMVILIDKSFSGSLVHIPLTKTL